MKVRRIYMIIVVVGVMVGCTSPRPSPGGEGGILPRPSATPSRGGITSALLKLWRMAWGWTRWRNIMSE